ncbi:LysB family phage lysis regulatory protein [Kushneria indalinina DSM 14324]|uniref:LysB family phage lysis regulatory protein n=1 Tax=Kushneria indalinina DSM 14324 TaxID=1122140 RepID=A0A3D9DVU6_9GAMM|nr:Rz-like lysis system protein LysB [Kushneria indalinina]REC94877.1 LysB family phage lysis regulatory protein [Kushneria indalinina DSM 14324]
MNRLIISGVLIAGLTLGGWALWQRGNAASERADRIAQQRDTAQQESQQRQLVINALWDNARRLESQRRALADQQTELARTASSRLEQIREIQRENDEIREWAGTRLPSDVIRLRQRPAVTGADAYRQSVRDPSALHPAGQSPGH